MLFGRLNRQVLRLVACRDWPWIANQLAVSKLVWRISATTFAPCQLGFDTPLSSITTLFPQSPLPARPHSWLPSLLTLPWLSYTSFLTPSFAVPFLSFLAPFYFPTLPTPPIYAYNMSILPHYIQLNYTGFATRDDAYDVMLQLRAVSPAALFSAASECRWRRRLSRFFARRHIFSSIFSFSNRRPRRSRCYVFYDVSAALWYSLLISELTGVAMRPLSSHRPITSLRGTRHLGNTPCQI